MTLNSLVDLEDNSGMLIGEVNLNLLVMPVDIYGSTLLTSFAPFE